MLLFLFQSLSNLYFLHYKIIIWNKKRGERVEKGKRYF